MIRPATPSDWLAIERLLTTSRLPLDGAREHLGGFVVVEHAGRIAGCAALERYGAVALLRSVAVDTAWRGTGLGDRLVRRLIDDARSGPFESVVLLTTTASEWFPRFGFHRTAREDIPSVLMASAELRGACPTTAVVMTLDL